MVGGTGTGRLDRIPDGVRSYGPGDMPRLSHEQEGTLTVAQTSAHTPANRVRVSNFFLKRI